MVSIGFQAFFFDAFHEFENGFIAALNVVWSGAIRQQFLAQLAQNTVFIQYLVACGALVASEVAGRKMQVYQY